MNNQAYGGITLSYELAASDAVGLWFASFRPRTFGDFNVSAQVKLPNFTPCLAYDSEIELASDLHLYRALLNIAGDQGEWQDSLGRRGSWHGEYQ